MQISVLSGNWQSCRREGKYSVVDTPSHGLPPGNELAYCDIGLKKQNKTKLLLLEVKGRWLEKEAALMIQCLMTPVELCNPDFCCGTCRSTRDGQWFVLRARSVFAFCPPPDWGGQWAACVAAQWRPAAVWSWWSLASLSGGHLPPYYLHPPPLYVLQAVFHLFL